MTSASTNGSMLLTEIGALCCVPPGPVRGSAMRHVSIIPNAALWIDQGRIAWFGPAGEAPRLPDRPDIVRRSAAGGCVIPGLVDCHTHISFAGQRCAEFERRLAGESYLSIMQSGGGIRVTTAAVRAATLEQLVAENLPRLARMRAAGVTTVECKSGYGLDPEHELKQLQAIRELVARQPLELVPTYLGAHAVPAEFDGRPDAFIDVIAAPELLERIAREKLAVFCDVFCDRGAFTVEQARRVLTRARAAGLLLKLHADELAQIGATRLAGELGATSADHLEQIDDPGIEALRAGGVIPVVLPGTSFFLGIAHADARRLIFADLPVALGTDCNPGSCMIESLPLVMNIACCQLRMHPNEVLVAATANAAAAIRAQDRLGAVAVGHQGDVVVLDAPSVSEWLYTPGRDRVRAVIKRGIVIHESAT